MFTTSFLKMHAVFWSSVILYSFKHNAQNKTLLAIPGHDYIHFYSLYEPQVRAFQRHFSSE